jgi:dihydroorotase
MSKLNSFNIIRPDDWHVHLREGDMLEAVTQHSSRINHRSIVMPNLEIPITTSQQGTDYKEIILSSSEGNNFLPLVPCYLTETLNLFDFETALKKNIFVGAKLYPTNATTNSSFGITKIENIFPMLEILEKLNKPLLVHGEKVREDIDIFDREKFFIDEELDIIRHKFTNLKIILEHVSSEYGANYVNNNNNIAGTITPHHLMLTKKDVFFDELINPHHFCMPVVKTEQDLIALRKYACSGNEKFFIGTDSAPHHVNLKIPNLTSKPGIFSAPCSIELYTTIFEEENALDQLENFCSINGPNFYNLPINADHIELIKMKWIVPEYTEFKDIKIKNFMGGKELNWKINQ